MVCHMVMATSVNHDVSVDVIHLVGWYMACFLICLLTYLLKMDYVCFVSSVLVIG